MFYEISDPETNLITGYIPEKAVLEAYGKQNLQPKTYDLIGRGKVNGFRATTGFSFGNKELRVVVQKNFRLLPVDEAC